MTRPLAILVAIGALCAAPSLFAEEHLVTPDAVQGRLAAQAAQRQADLAQVDRALATPTAQAAAASVGADLAKLRHAVPTLSDDELRDLAVRAAALDSDPAAGLDSDIRLLLMIFLIVAIVILVLQAVD
jgi:hypothetical protein